MIENTMIGCTARSGMLWNYGISSTTLLIAD